MQVRAEEKILLSLRRRALIMILAVLVASVALCAALRGQELCTLIRFGVRTLHSETDADGDFIDDATDMMLGARRYIETQPVYDSVYCEGGYPPEGRGVCTDVIWKAYEAAGYDFKAMVDADIAENQSAYPLPDGRLDPNIDFRRVVNLMVYFERNAQSMTTDPDDIAAWQPGDIVFYEGHVAIISDQRNERGQPFIIHHAGSGPFEEDALIYKSILAHFRSW